jgi:predicted house-cleaning noncanonical NTP pyrophosphatase (MazG superfamily)
LQQKITEVSQKSQQLRNQAQTSYHAQINEAIKEINKNRELSIAQTKLQTAILQKKTQQKIQEFLTQSFLQNQQQIIDIANLIKNKIFS